MSILYDVGAQMTAKWSLVIIATVRGLTIILQTACRAALQAATATDTASGSGSCCVKLPPESEAARHVTRRTAASLQAGSRWTHKACRCADAVRIVHPKENCHLQAKHFIYKAFYNHYMTGGRTRPLRVSFDGVHAAAFLDDDMQVCSTNGRNAGRAQIIQDAVLHLPAYCKTTLGAGARGSGIGAYCCTVPLAVTPAVVQNDDNKKERGKTTGAAPEDDFINRSYAEVLSGLLFPACGLSYDSFSFNQNPGIIHRYGPVEKTSCR